MLKSWKHFPYNEKQDKDVHFHHFSVFFMGPFLHQYMFLLVTKEDLNHPNGFTYHLS